MSFLSLWLVLFLGILLHPYVEAFSVAASYSLSKCAKKKQKLELRASAANDSNRREALIRLPASLLALIAGKPAFAGQDSSSPQTVLITGANSGIGFEACKRLATQPDKTLLVTCRSLSKAQQAISSIQATVPDVAATLLPIACDLADLSSIEAVLPQLPAPTIDTLCLNAGLARNAGSTDCVRTRDGWEMTVGVNHVGHFYLQHLLQPRMASDGRIVITASGVHDPESPGGAQGIPATLGSLEGLENMGRECEMIDGGSFNGDKAYKDSKLCNVLFAQELQRRLSASGSTKGISVNCFNPGLIVSTGLFRDQNPFFTKLFDFAATDLLKVGETPAWGGAALSYMTTLETKGVYYSSPPGSAKYGDDAFGNQFCQTAVSKEAQDQVKAQRLWDLTAKTLGIQA